MLEKYLNIALVFPNLSALTKDGVLKELAECIANVHKELATDVVLSSLLEREKLDSTGIENGVAIPHAKIDKLEQLVIAVGRSKKGVDFDSHDGVNTKLFFVMLTPSTAIGDHMKALARLSRLLTREGLKEKLLEAGNAKDIYDAVIKADNDV